MKIKLKPYASISPPITRLTAMVQFGYILSQLRKLSISQQNNLSNVICGYLTPMWMDFMRTFTHKFSEQVCVCFSCGFVPI